MNRIHVHAVSRQKPQMVLAITRRSGPSSLPCGIGRAFSLRFGLLKEPRHGASWVSSSNFHSLTSDVVLLRCHGGSVRWIMAGLGEMPGDFCMYLRYC